MKPGGLGVFFDRLLEGTVYLSMMILLFIMLSVSLDVIRRYLFNQPFIWITQISEYGLVYITFLGSAWLLKHEGHVYMETVVELLNKKFQAMLGVLNSVIGIVVSTFFTFYGFIVTFDHFKRGIYEPTILQLPDWPVLLVIPLGSLLLLIQFMRRTLYYTNLFWAETKKLAGRE